MTDQSYEIERYKYILSRIGHCNDAVPRYFALYQSLTSIILAGLFASFHGRSSEGGPKPMITIGLTILTLIAGLSLLLILVTMRTWFSYRLEETRILHDRAQTEKPPPTWADLLKWQETWMAFSIILVTLGAWAFVPRVAADI